MSFSNLLSSMVSRSSDRNDRRRSKTLQNSSKLFKTRKLRLEALEARELLAGYLGATSDAQLNPIMVTTGADVVADDGHISLREAIANAVDNDTITFASGVENCVLGSELVSTKTYTIDGYISADLNVTIHGSETMTSPGADIANTDAVRILNLESGSLIVKNLHFKNGFARASASEVAPTHQGGAVYVAGNATLTVNNCDFYYNYAMTSGGAIHVAATGALNVDKVNFNENYSSRGGAVANFGSFYASTTLGSVCFIDNVANGKVFETVSGYSANITRGFGGAIYNAKDFQYFGGGQSGSSLGFRNNKAISDRVNQNGVLLGGSGGAIYNTFFSDAEKGSVNLYNAKLNGNTATKYGGAISNFGTLVVNGATFTGNSAATGGALQTSNHANISAATFSGNHALGSEYRLVERGEYGFDFGGNGGAIYACGSQGVAEGYLRLGNTIDFDGNTATNAGGAIDFINGQMSFAANDSLAFRNNSAGVIGGAIVIASSAYSSVGFSGTTSAVFSFLGNTSDYYAPNIAVSTCVKPNIAANFAQNFFGVSQPAPQYLDTFVRYYTANHKYQVTYDKLARLFATSPNKVHVSIKDAPSPTIDDPSTFTVLRKSDTTEIPLGTGSYVIRCFADDNPDIMFTENIKVVDANTSVIAAQIDLDEHPYINDGTYAAGFSLRVYSSILDPVAKWLINWGDGSSTLVEHLGYTCNTYHAYTAANTYTLSLTTYDADDNVTFTGNIGLYRVAARSVPSGAVLEDLDFVDDLFVEL